MGLKDKTASSLTLTLSHEEREIPPRLLGEGPVVRVFLVGGNR